MRMDIASPAEMLHFDQIDFDGIRKQAYITFLNESPYSITAISGILSLINEMGDVVEERRVSFAKMKAGPYESFTCPLALDGYPEFLDAEMLVVDVFFAEVEPWALDFARVKDYVPPLMVRGAEGVALAAVAGDDAICYPYQDGGNWVCVCGRFNRRRWNQCRRCRRVRDEIFEAFAPERVAEAYENMREQVHVVPPQTIVEERKMQPRPDENRLEMEAPVQQARVRRRENPERPKRPLVRPAENPVVSIPKAPRKKRQSTGKTKGAFLTVGVCILLAALLFTGFSSIRKKLPNVQDSNTVYMVDYLDPIP